jgi:hypothetical protein
MFQCQKCNKTVPAGHPTNRIVVEKREREYEKEIYYGRLSGTVEQVKGWEIAKELIVCPECYSESTGLAARVIETPQPPIQKAKPFFSKQYRENNYHNNYRQDIRPVVETINHIPTKE